jgi:hypothetical protein
MAVEALVADLQGGAREGFRRELLDGKAEGLGRARKPPIADGLASGGSGHARE